jgi:hypothetical protein
MMKVDRTKIMDAQIAELRAIKSDMDRTDDSLEVVMGRRPKWIGWIDENGNVRESPR